MRRSRLPASIETLADLVEHLGGVPLERIRLSPPPGTATERDVIATRAAPERRLCELVDGVLVEKAMGPLKSALGVGITSGLLNFMGSGRQGVVFGADGMFGLRPGLVRIPDGS